MQSINGKSDSRAKKKYGVIVKDEEKLLSGTDAGSIFPLAA